MYKFINTRHIRKGAVGEMRHILLVHVKHHTKRGVQFAAIARDHLRDESWPEISDISERKHRAAYTKGSYIALEFTVRCGRIRQIYK